MKKKLTVNALALGNIKARKKQYLIMIIGILLAMVFSSSIIFFFFSASETAKVTSENEIGRQDLIFASDSFTEQDVKDLVKDNYITTYGLAHCIGRAYTNNEGLCGVMCWLDDAAMERSNQIFLEGRYPCADDEIAVERNQLLNFNLPKAEIGDKITLKVKVANGFESANTIEREYPLVGIVSDKASNITKRWMSEDEKDNIVPSVFVAQNTEVDAGGKELLIAYVNLAEELQDQANLLIQQTNEFYDATSVLYTHFSDDLNVDYGHVDAHSIRGSYVASLDELFEGGSILIWVIIVMVFAACVAIVNSFNSNLKDRKNQIGLMRAVGATKRQIIRIYGREAFIISLIVTPLSILISYFLVKLLLGFISKDAVMSKSIIALLVAAVINLLVVMLAAFIPLKSASRITPMQAIRNINNNRKVKTKKIKSKKQFKTSKLWADRSRAFYKGSHITVSIILASTVLFSCVSASAISYSINDLHSLPADYYLSDYMASDNYIVNRLTQKGFTQADYQQLYSKPYVSEIIGSKSISVNVVMDEYNDLIRAMNSDLIVFSNYEEYQDNPKSIEEYTERYNAAIEKGNYIDTIYDQYDELKNFLNIDADKEFYSLDMYGTDDKAIAGIEDYLTSGKIDYKKLSSGEEVILVAPQVYENRIKFYKNGSMGMMTALDDEAQHKEPGYKTAVHAECPYKVGDIIEFVYAQGEPETTKAVDENSEYQEETPTNYKNAKIVKKSVRIGAIISPEAIRNSSNLLAFSPDLGIITDLQGINNLYPNRNYYNLRINCAYELDEEADREIMEDLSYLSANGDRWLESNYSYISWQKEQSQTLFVAMLSVTIIGFAICASIINNSLSSRIRESKKVIGMLRTVGADRVTLVKSFIMQMLSMFGWGIGIGYGLYFIAYIALTFTKSVLIHDAISLTFNPWISVIMTILMFAVCSINLWVKIRKEMKNSIIENIREL